MIRIGSRFHRFSIFLFLALFSFASAPLAEPNPHDFENWKTDFSKTSIKLHEVLSGGPLKDGIPAIDNPKFVSISEAKTKDRESVIGFANNGEAKAYPLSILMWHEIANDIVGGHPFTVTYCPLCNAAIVFDAELDGTRFDFGTTGRLRNSDLLMYDRQSESWWQQFSGEAVIGELTGTKLKIMPSRLESFASFKQRFPNGKVLVPNDPNLREYGRNPYVSYDSRSGPYPLFIGELPADISPMARVVVIRKDGAVKHIIAMDKLVQEETLTLGDFQLTWSPGRASALDTAAIDAGREVGNLWVTETLDGKAQDVVHDITFAFVAHAFHPKIPIQQ
ncbi:MAG: DUF3179 domain-containing protein [Salaquimonas sp.]